MSSDAEGATEILRGRSPQIPLPGLVEFLSATGVTGTLHVTAGDESFVVEMRDGQIVRALGGSTPMDERLGAILLRRGSLGAEQLQSVLDGAEDRRGLLGNLLEEAGLVTRDELLAALNEQAGLLFRRLFAHNEAAFRFEAESIEVQDLEIQASVTALLLDGARGQDESQKPLDSSWEDWLK